jgi:hypothetical protein
MQSNDLRSDLLDFVEVEKEKIIKAVQEMRRQDLRDEDGYSVWTEGYTQRYIEIMKVGIEEMKEKILKILRKRKASEAELANLLIDPYGIFREVATERLREIKKEKEDGEI